MANTDEKRSGVTHLADEVTHLSENSDINFKPVGAVDEIEALIQEVKVIFVKQCKWIIYSLAVIWFIETTLVITKYIKPDERIFTEKVLMTLVGATIVQVGAVITGITLRQGRSAGKSK